MTDYIEREALINAIATSTEPFTTGLVFIAINNQPAADVAPVKIGFWKISGVNPANNVIGNFKCSLCARTSLEDSDYCPHCGAKMEETK
nr:MAG TPA: zinc-ribbon containing domain protein [Bacteriophage sp.]